MEEAKLISEFNEAGYQIQRLHNIWLACRVAKEKGNLKDYKLLLDSAKIELNNDLEKKDSVKHNFKERLEKLDDVIEEYSSFVFISSGNINNLNPKLKDIFYRMREILYKKLQKKEELIREIQEAAGKGGKYHDFEEEGFD